MVYIDSMIALTYSTRPQKCDHYALVAQLDRVLGYEPSGRRFESFRVRHIQKPCPYGRGFLLAVRRG